MTTRRRTIAWSDPYEMAARRFGMSGLGFFESIAAGEAPPAPIYPFLNISLLNVEHGRCRLACDPTDQLYNPLGTLHGGVPASLIDTAMGISTQSTLDEGKTVATIRLHVDYLRSIDASTGRIFCDGQAVRVGRRVAVTLATVTDGNGRILARGYANFMVLQGRPPAVEPSQQERSRTFAWPDPAVLPAAHRQTDGLGFLSRLAAGKLPNPAISETLGFSLTEVERGRAVFEGDVAEFHYNPMGGVHGGFPATLLDSATGVAVHSTLAQGQAFTTMFLRVDFFRGMTVETGHVRCEGRLVHDDGRIAIADGEVVDEAGKIYARGSSTCLKFDL